MARARNIKPGFFRNEIIGEMPVEFRLLFIGLWTAADREGRLEYRPKRIKAEIFPYDDINVMDGLSMLRECGFIEIYISNDQELIQVINWSKHQNPHHKEIASVLPAPEGHKDTVCAGYIPLNNTIRNRIYQRDGRKCKHCGVEHGLSIDHIIPVSKGGNSVDENLQVLCIGCNIRKGNTISNMVHAQAIDESYINNKQVDISGSSPLDSLIPDSLIPDSLIPDSLIPDSLNPDSLNPESLLLNPESLKPIPEKKPTVANAPRGERETCFDQFWGAYPAKVGRGDAIKAWKKIISPTETLELILQALSWQRNCPAWLKNDGEYIPNPATYLNGKRWLDEPRKQSPPGTTEVGRPLTRDEGRAIAARSIFKDEHIQHLQGEKNEPAIDAKCTRIE